MQCYIYRSSRKPDTYLYLCEKDDFSALPEALLALFGQPEFCFDFELTPTRKLACEDAAEVIRNLAERGFHLQMSAENGEPF